MVLSITVGLISPALGAVGIIKLYGGVINANEWVESDTADASIEVGGGVLVVNGNKTGTSGNQGLQGHINAGLITVAPGYTLSLDYDVTNPGKTTLAAISDLNPYPADNSQVGALLAALTWTIPDPNVVGGTVTCDVYLGSPDDIFPGYEAQIGDVNSFDTVPVYLSMNHSTNETVSTAIHRGLGSVSSQYSILLVDTLGIDGQGTDDVFVGIDRSKPNGGFVQVDADERSEIGAG